MKVLTIAGARPNFMKVAPLVHAFRRAGLDAPIVHTGQHYDERMSQTFFDELDIPRPDINLEVGSGSHIWQLAETMRRLEPVLADMRPHAVVVVGDVNSTVAAAITAVKMGIKLAHVEAGLRSFDRSMPEEINRILTDSISDLLFTSEPSGEVNLLNEGIPRERIHFVGNVMIDTLLAHRQQASGRQTASRLGLNGSSYAVMTLHRPSNVDIPDHLNSIFDAMEAICARLPVVFVVHPRTRQSMSRLQLEHRLQLPGLLAVEPQGYLDMLSLMESARFVLTDSGGMQEETTVLGVPCITLRENTERPVTIQTGNNTLAGWDTHKIVTAAQMALDGSRPAVRCPEKWDGRAADRITEILAG